MSIYDELDFAPVLITDVFESMSASAAQLGANSLEPGTTAHPHIGQSENTNGIARFIAAQTIEPNEGGALTVGVDTQVVFYQPVAFYTTEKVLILRSSRMNQESALVLKAALEHQFRKFSWGYKASAGRLAKTRIMVPVTRDSSGAQVVDWDGMTRFGRELLSETVNQAHRGLEDLITPANEDGTDEIEDGEVTA